MDAISNEMIENEGKIDGELETAIPGNYWNKLKQQNGGNLAYHTISTLVKIVSDKKFQKMNKLNQNIVLWAGLLHNISKREAPEIVGNDNIQAFMSAATTLKIFKDMGLV